MKKLIILFILFFISRNVHSQINPIDSLKIEKSQILSGIVIDFKTGTIIPNAFVQLYNGEELLDSKQTAEDASFSFSVICNKRFNIKARAENFAINSTIVFSTKSQKDKIWKIKLYPIREFKYLTPNKLLDVDEITFIMDKLEFTLMASKQLDKVAGIMEKYPLIKISVNVHTDSNGIAEYDLKMTQERADTILSYLIDKGIDSERLGAIGYGSTQLLNHCIPDVKCTRAEHKANRRTEFLVL